jgi:hypothetical protein
VTFIGQGMSFDYNAPAELFLAKRTKSNRENYRRFATAAEAIRYAVETLRTPKAFGARLRSGTSGLTAPKSSASTKRCPSLTDRAPAPVRNEADGAPSSRKSQGKVPAAPLSKNRVNPRALAMTLTGVVKR